MIEKETIIMEDIQSVVTIKELYSLDQTMAKPLLEKLTYPWEALPLIKGFVLELGKSLDKDEYKEVDEHVWIHKSCKVYGTATILGPTIIGAGTEVRPGAFIRGSVLVGENCVIGNSTELKNVIIFNNVQVPHYNYVGDSVLGFKSHMGAGSITSNVKSDKTLVHVKGKVNGQNFDIATGLKKFGAMLGDNVEVGCNSVLNPGTVIGRFSNIYPVSRVRGYVPGGSIFKDKDNIVAKQ